jgi:hypothetical protein
VCRSGQVTAQPVKYSKRSFLLRNFFKTLIQSDSDVEKRRPGSHVLGTLNILRSPREQDTTGVEPAWDPYDRENLGHHVLYPVALRSEIQKQNRINGLRFLAMGSSV